MASAIALNLDELLAEQELKGKVLLDPTRCVGDKEEYTLLHIVKSIKKCTEVASRYSVQMYQSKECVKWYSEATGTSTVKVEKNHYFSSTSINKEYYKESETQTICPWKGIWQNIILRPENLSSMNEPLTPITFNAIFPFYCIPSIIVKIFQQL